MKFGKNFLIWSVIIIFLVAIYDLTGQGSSNLRNGQISFSEFLDNVDRGNVESVNMRGSYIDGKLTSGEKFSTYNPNYSGLIDRLSAKKVAINAGPTETAMNSFVGILLSWFPILLLIGVWIFFMRQMQGGGKGGGAMGFGRSKAKLMNMDKKKITFADVAGIDEAKEELEELADFLKSPDKFSSLGGKIPRGCLLIGSPGTGKTLLAKAIAGEANVPFFSISGSDFVEMFVGVGASRVRDLFEQGKKNAPCLIFIDEIDAVGRHRGGGIGGGNDEREQTLNQLLVEMDGFEENMGVIIIAATNRPDVLDPALLRPGRFDRQIIVPLPDVLGREKILDVHLRKIPTAPDVNKKILARGTPGFTGADLANLVNESALISARRNKKIVTMAELEEAKDKVMMGAERKSMVIGEEEKLITAWHEAGHAIVGIFSSASDPIHKATIIPRGRALGMVMRLPEKDRLSLTRAKAKADIAVAMGGRVAEEMVFGYDKVTSGASQDIKMATNMSRLMVTEWGMSDKLGPLYHSADQQEMFLGRSIGQQKNSSDATAELIDEEIKKLVMEGYKTAQKILKDNFDKLEKLALALIEYETLSGDEINDLLAGKQFFKKNPEDDKPKKPGKKSSVPNSIINEEKSSADIVKEKIKEKVGKIGKEKISKPAAPEAL